MAKIRVGQLAKELNLQVGNVLARLRELGAEVKTNLSTVEEEVAGRLRASLKGSEKKSTDAPAKTAGARTPAGTGKTATAKTAAKSPAPARVAASISSGPATMKTAPGGVTSPRPVAGPTVSAPK